jgi:hypothetical protein
MAQNGHSIHPPAMTAWLFVTIFSDCSNLLITINSNSEKDIYKLYNSVYRKFPSDVKRQKMLFILRHCFAKKYWCLAEGVDKGKD